MLSQRTLIVGGDEFILTQFPSSMALKYSIAVGRIVGHMIAGGLAGDGALGGDGESFDLADDMDVSGLITGLLGQLDEEKTPELIKSMLRDAISAYTFDGTKRTAWDDDWYEIRFAGALEDLVELIAAIVEDNFLQAIITAKKKLPQAPRNTSGKYSENSTGANGSGRLIPEEPPTSFFE